MQASLAIDVLDRLLEGCEFQYPDGTRGWFELRVTAAKVTAHDVNNHLSVIRSAGQRAADLTRTLLPSRARRVHAP